MPAAVPNVKAEKNLLNVLNRILVQIVENTINQHQAPVGHAGIHFRRGRKVKFGVILDIVDFLIQWWVLFGVFIVESFTRIIVHPKESLENIDSEEKDDIVDRANELNSRALSLIALVVAGVSIILSQSQESQGFLPGLRLLALSASFLIVSHQSRNLIRNQRYWSELQERTMEYGALGLFASLILLYDYYSVATTGTIILQSAFVVIILIRANAVFKLTSSDYRKWRECVGGSRLLWLLRYEVNLLGDKIDWIKELI